jgi:hypothetical protein
LAPQAQTGKMQGEERQKNTARSQPPLMQMSYQQLTACKEEDGHWLALMIKLDPIFSNTAAAQPFGGCWL